MTFGNDPIISTTEKLNVLHLEWTALIIIEVFKMTDPMMDFFDDANLFGETLEGLPDDAFVFWEIQLRNNNNFKT